MSRAPHAILHILHSFAAGDARSMTWNECKTLILSKNLICPQLVLCLISTSVSANMFCFVKQLEDTQMGSQLTAYRFVFITVWMTSDLEMMSID